MAYDYEFPYFGDANYNNDWLISKLKEIASNLSQLSIDFDDLKVQFNAFSETTAESITRLQNDVNTLKTQVEAIIAGGGGNVGDLTDILNRISALETDFASLQTTVAGHTTDISSLQTTVAGHTTDISSLQTTVAGHTTDISSLQTTVAGHTTDISSLQTTVAGHTGAINAIQTNLAELSTSIDEIEVTLSSHQTQLQNLISQGNEQQATLVQQGQQISSLQNQINNLPTGGGNEYIWYQFSVIIQHAGTLGLQYEYSKTEVPIVIPQGYVPVFTTNWVNSVNVHSMRPVIIDGGSYRAVLLAEGAVFYENNAYVVNVFYINVGATIGGSSSSYKITFDYQVLLKKV